MVDVAFKDIQDQFTFSQYWNVTADDLKATKLIHKLKTNLKFWHFTSEVT